MQGLTPVDAVFAGIVLLSLLMGAWRGVVRECLALASWVLAFFLARTFAADATLWLPLARDASAQVRYALAFALVFVLGMVAVSLLGWLLAQLIETTGLRPVDRSLGAVFGVVRAVLMLLLVVALVHALGWQTHESWTQARSVPWLEGWLAQLKPVLPAALQSLLRP